MKSAQADVSSPRSVFKDILRGSGLYSIALIAPRVVSVVMLPIVTRKLTSADYGILDLLEQISVILTLLLGAGFASALGYFYYESDVVERRRAVVGTAIVGGTALGAIAALLCWPFAGTISRMVFGTASVRPYLMFVIITLPLSFLLENVTGWMRVENRRVAYLISSLLRLVLTVGSVLVLVALLGMRIRGMLISSTITIGVTGLCGVAYCIHAVRPTIDPKLFFRMAKFSAPIGIGGAAAFFMNFGDRLILPHYVAFAQIGIYALAYKIGILIAVVYASFHVYWSAQVFNMIRHPDFEVIFARTFTYVIAGLAFCGLGVAVFAKPVISVLAPREFQGAAPLVPVIAAAYCVKAVGDFLRCLFIAQGKPVYDAISNWIGAVACLGAYAILIPRMGIWGAAIATLLAFVVMGIVSVVWTYRIQPWRVEPARLIKVGLALVVALAPFSLMAEFSRGVQFGVACLSVLLFPAVLLLSRFLTKGEIDVARTAVQKVSGRFLPSR